MTDCEEEKFPEESPSSTSPTSSPSNSSGDLNVVAQKGYSGVNTDDLVFDHGWKAWSQVLASFFLFFNTWGIATAFGVFQTYYQEHILSQESPSTISWIGSVQSSLLLFVGAVTGPLFDAGYSRALLIFGWFMIPFGLMMTSISTKFWQIMLSQGVCCGLGFGAAFMPSVAVFPQYFKRKRALANGIAATGSGLGGVIYPIMLRQLQLQLGFAWATRILGFFAFGTMSISMLLLRVRFKPQEKRSLIQVAALREPVFLLFCLAMFIGFLGMYNTLVYVQPYAIQTGIMDEHLGFYLVSMLNAASTIGRLAPNYVADFIGPFNVMAPMCFCGGILAFAWVGIHSASGIIALVVLYGFTTGGFVSTPPVVLISITPDLRDFGTRLGMSFVFSSAGALVGTPIGGAILNHTGNDYLGVKLLVGCCLVSSSLILMTARLIKTGPKFLAQG